MRPTPSASITHNASDTEEKSDLSASGTATWTFGPYDYDDMDPHGGYTVGTISLSDGFNTTTLGLVLASTGYAKPSITSISAYRAEAVVDGGTTTYEEADDGTCLGIDLEWAVFQSASQTDPSSVTVVVKDLDAADAAHETVAVREFEPTGVSAILNVYPDAIEWPDDVVIGGELINTAHRYTVEVALSDLYSDEVASAKAVRSELITVAYFTMDFLAGGHGIAMGKPSTTAELLDVGYGASFDGDVDASGDIKSDGEVTATDTNDVLHNLTEKIDAVDVENGYLPLAGGTLTDDLGIRASNIDRSTTPSENTYSNATLRLEGSSGNAVAIFDTAKFANGDAVSRWVTYNNNSNSEGRYSIVQHVKPATDANNDGYISSLADIHLNHKKIYWKESGYGDKFAITPYFSGADDANLLKIQSAVGAAGTDPALTDKVTISGKSGNVWVKGSLELSGTGIYNPSNIEFKPSSSTANNGGYIDFHYNQSTADYTSRIIESASGKLNLVASNGITFNGGALPVANGGTGRSIGANRTFWCGRIIYDNNSGSSGNISVTETFANFTFVLIGFKENDGYYDGMFVRSPNGKTVVLHTAESTVNGANNPKWQTRTLSGTACNVVHYADGTSATNHIYITHIIGFA